jgi:type 2A phosphatase activator TIP41
MPSTTHEIPLKLLARQDPVLDRILFYDDVALFEDELHDNGESILNVRIRVMPHSLFILSRLFVRVDNVLFRIYDVRLYHEFGSDEVIRECSGFEADYDDVKAVSL